MRHRIETAEICEDPDCKWNTYRGHVHVKYLEEEGKEEKKEVYTIFDAELDGDQG